eukprot:SAG11_NODE_28671_length_319_cov_0.700000_1_plen_38_part_01
MGKGLKNEGSVSVENLVQNGHVAAVDIWRRPLSERLAF